MSQLNKLDLDSVYSEVIDSGYLGTSKRRRELFKYLWNHTFSSDAEAVTQYTIAFDVLGRPDTFNPETDGIVRTEIGRLRGVLKSFSNQSPSYSVEIPKGKYELVVSKKIKQSVYQIKKVQLAAFSAAVAALFLAVIYFWNPIRSDIASYFNSDKGDVCSFGGPVIEVENNSNETEFSRFILTSIEGVILQNSHLILKDDACQSVAAPEYSLEVSIVEHGADHSVILTARAKDEKKHLALIEFDISGDQQASYQNLFFEVAKHVNDITKPYGLLVKNAISKEWQDPQARDSFACLVKMYEYYGTETDDDYLAVHECLMAASEMDNVLLDIQGGLAASYVEQGKLYRDATVEEPWSQAEDILSRNEGFINQSAELMMAKIAFEADNPNYSSEALDDALLLAESSFSAHPVVLLTASVYAGSRLGEWERANRLSIRTKQLTKQRDQSIYAVDAYNLIMSPRNDVNFENCFKYYSKNSVVANLVVKSCANKTDNEFWRDKTGQSLRDLGYESIEKQIAFLEDRAWHPSLIDKMIELIGKDRI